MKCGISELIRNVFPSLTEALLYIIVYFLFNRLNAFFYLTPLLKVFEAEQSFNRNFSYTQGCISKLFYTFWAFEKEKKHSWLNHKTCHKYFLRIPDSLVWAYYEMFNHMRLFHWNHSLALYLVINLHYFTVLLCNQPRNIWLHDLLLNIINNICSVLYTILH